MGVKSYLAFYYKIVVNAYMGMGNEAENKSNAYKIKG